MEQATGITPQEIEALYQKLDREAEEAGYHLNPDTEMTRELLNGYLVNQRRFGYPACPCRLASGNKEEDLDIICPCDYRDPDIEEFGGCYCSLYVSKDVKEGKAKIGSIPERRPPRAKRMQMKQEEQTKQQNKAPNISSLPLPVWRCKVCGYLCARESPPGTCPICKAGKERFERFM